MKYINSVLLVIGLILGTLIVFLSLLGSAMAIEVVLGSWVGIGWFCFGSFALLFICAHCAYQDRKR